MKRLEELLDRKNLEKLMAEYGGKRIWIPKPGNRGYRDAASLEQRNKDILLLHDNGKPIRELARLYRLSIKTVYGIVNAASGRDQEGKTLKDTHTILAAK